MADHGGNGGTREVVDRLEDRGGPMETQPEDQQSVETRDQQSVEAITNTSATVEDGGDGLEGREQEADNEEKGRSTEGNPRAMVLLGAVGSIVESEGSGTVAEGSPTVGGSSGGVCSSSAMGDILRPNTSLPRDPARGKGVVAEEEEATEIPVEYREQDVAFRPAETATTSSRHVPVTKQDIAEHLPDDQLARLLEENPEIGEIVLKAKEERAQAIAAWEAAEKTERERKDREEPLREMEAEERAAEEAQGPRVTAVAEAAAVIRPDYAAETYTPPTPHLFVLSLVLYEGLPQRVRELVDATGFEEFIRTLTRSRIDHAVLVALAERWRDTTNTFHLPIGEITVTPADVVAITGLRVGGEPIPFDSGIQDDQVALDWFLGDSPKIEEGMARYEQFMKYLKKKVTTEQEAERMARAYLLYLFGATLYPNRCSRVHLSYLPALRDLSTASRFDWGGAALGTAYAFLGHSSRTGKSTAGYWRVWELWAYEVLRMYPPQCKHPDLSTLPRALIWSKKNMGPKEGRGSLNAYRLYLDELRASQINWNPWSVAGVEPEYLARSRAITASRVLLESAFGWHWYLGDRVLRQSLGYTAFQPDTELRCYLRPEMDYVAYQRDRLAGPLGIRAFRDVRSQVRGAAEERRVAGERSRGSEGRVRLHAGVPVRGGPPEMSWTTPVVDAQGNPTEIHLVPARVEPPLVTVLKKLAARTLAPPVVSQRQTRSSQPVAATKEAARQAVVRAEEQFRIAVRKRLASEEQRAQKKRKLVLLPTSEDEEEDDGEEEEDEDEEEDDEEHSSARSDFDDSVDDPAYKEDPKERADDDDDDADDEHPEVCRDGCPCMARCPSTFHEVLTLGTNTEDNIFEILPINEWHSQQCKKHPSPRSLGTPILLKMESPLAAILDPWLTRFETTDWESPRSQCLSSIRDLRFMETSPELLQAAMVYWDPVMHVFRFHNNEMCPTVEEFQAYLQGFTDCEVLAIPLFQEDMSQLVQTKLNISEELSASIIQNGNLNIVRLIEMYGPEGALGDYVGQAHRRFMLSVCALAAYMLIPANEGVSPSIVSMALQMDARKNIMPVVLAETLIGLDLVKSGQASWFSGCPLLLQLWLSDKVGILEAPEAGFEHFLRQLVERPIVYPELMIEEWVQKSDPCRTDELHLLHPRRTLRQLGRNQESRCYGRERFRLPTFDSHNLQAYEYGWNNRELEEPLPDPITWLESRYVKWLHREVKARLGGYF
ncbi:hypothetical protein RHMOL_Rhmol04G0231400 [Rhododendron molle]|uniref:Uncharacterized protein n=1 Tax=Rhododendron molle TaxID=49168 RepID=A0ACC0P395_RHOML|nr:hypothetical protein RHMOL_Rhmol04G0231400 [Rhododendron molle]